MQRLSTEVGASDGSVVSKVDTFHTEEFNRLLGRLGDGGERDLDMRERALHQEKPKRIDVLRDQIDEMEVQMDTTGRDVYRTIINRQSAELRKLEEKRCLRTYYVH